MKGKWTQVKGRVKQQWGKLTDDDLTRIERHLDELVGRVQERYGIAKEEAERQIREWERRAAERGFALARGPSPTGGRAPSSGSASSSGTTPCCSRSGSAD